MRAKGIELPPVPANRAKFLLDFLPPVQRIVGREGIEIYGLRYSSPALAPEVQPGISRVVRVDPRDLARVYLERPDATYLTVPLRDPTGPVMSLWEWRAPVAAEPQCRTLDGVACPPGNPSATGAPRADHSQYLERLRYR